MEFKNKLDTDPGPQDPVLWWQYTNTHGLQKPCGEKGAAQLLSNSERGPLRPPPRQAFIVFLGTLHQGWSSLLCIDLFWVVIFCRQRVSLNTSKKDICNVKGEVVETGYAPYLGDLAQILGN